tara:strand:- start:800 stop:1051 length:252 start_codon:yes stop_codon:yes gene_type:complete
MSLNIKNEDTHKLARELAELTGESMTTAVTEALRERLERVRRRKNGSDMVRDLLAIADEIAKMPVLDDRDHAEILYDERGLPR